MSSQQQRQTLGRWLVRNARSVLRALATSDDEEHQALARDLAPRIGADLSRLDDKPPVLTPRWSSRRY